MKSILSILSVFVIMLIAACNVSAQNHGTMGVGDTLTVSSAVDTIYLYVSGNTLSQNKELAQKDELYINLRLDSLSGSPGGTLTIEYTNSDSPTEIGVEWFAPASGSSVFTYMNGATAVTASSTSAVSWTVNGTKSLLSWSDPNFNANYARARYVVASSSQSERARGWYSVR